MTYRKQSKTVKINTTLNANILQVNKFLMFENA